MFRISISEICLEETDKDKTSIENVEMGYGYGV